jgi:hypothetical protein
MKVSVRDSADLREVSKQLRQVADGKALRKELTGGIRDALKPVLAQVKSAYRAGPSRGRRHSKARQKHGSLRVMLAKASRIEVRTSGKMAGARLRVDGRRMPDTFKAIPRYWEGQGTRWRHPVFADRETWVQQEPHPTFYRIVVPQEDRIGTAIDRVLEDVRDKLERG